MCIWLKVSTNSSGLHRSLYLFFKKTICRFSLRQLITKEKKYDDNFCFFRNVICTHELAKMPKKFKPKCIKAATVKELYAELQVRMPELPVNTKDFRGFNLMQLNKACQHLKINGYIFDCDVTTDGVKGRPGCLQWRINFVEGGTQINMLHYEGHLMFIKEINTFFKQWQCGKCRRCFNKVDSLNDHAKTCNGTEVKRIWSGGVYEPPKKY